ncbi:MAG: metallophosphoesterase, partial [Thomasclavelia spiroformis]
MKAIKKIIATAICLMMVMGLCICNPVSATEEPLLTVAFMSDLHNQQSTLESGNIRNSITKVCDDLAANENTDVLVIGGDVTSDSYVSKPVLESVLGKVVNETNKVTKNTLWITGNHDYNAGERDGYDSAPYYEFYMKENVGELSDLDSYYEEYKREPQLLAYHYVIKGFDFICLNTSHEMLEGGKQNTNYAYSDGTMNWVDNKLEELGKDKTVFVVGHFPFRDSHSLSSSSKGMTVECDNKFKSILSKYPNVLYFYGHDHGTDSAYIRSDTAQRTTEYLTDGSIKPEISGIGDSVLWTLEKTDDGYSLQNVQTGKYLGYEGNLNTIENRSSWEIVKNNDSLTLKYLENGRSLHIGTGNKFSLGSASPIKFYQQIGDEYLESNSLTEGTTYVLVSNENYALTNLTNGASGESIRLEPLYVEKTENGICDAKIAEPSFISTFMGSLRYYNNSIEDGPTVEDSKVVQNLMMYVYKDRIELQMKNHGVKNGGEEIIEPVVIKKDMTNISTDKTALKIAIDLANAITEDDLKNVIPVVVEEFKAARDKANAVYNDASATQDEVNVAFDRLASVMQKLEFYAGDKTALKAFIDKVSDLDSSKYTETTWTQFNDALTAANGVYEDVNAMQPEVNEA